MPYDFLPQNADMSAMSKEPRRGPGGQALSSVGAPSETMGRTEAAGASREIDERTAIYLLSLARELLRRDHSAIANMIDYAIVEIETPADE